VVKSRQRGFWLGEVVVAIGLIAVVSLTVVGVFSFLSITSQTRSEQAAADLLADTLMESAVAKGPPDWGLSPGQLFTENPVELESGDSKAKEHMVFQVIPQELEDAELGKLFRVRVRVSWQEPPGPDNVERGKGYIERMRTVYIEDV
jgi:hypothetical protein